MKKIATLAFLMPVLNWGTLASATTSHHIHSHCDVKDQQPDVDLGQPTLNRVQGGIHAGKIHVQWNTPFFHQNGPPTNTPNCNYEVSELKSITFSIELVEGATLVGISEISGHPGAISALDESVFEQNPGSIFFGTFTVNVGSGSHDLAELGLTTGEHVDIKMPLADGTEYTVNLFTQVTATLTIPDIVSATATMKVKHYYLPEPSTSALVLVALCLAMGRRRAS